jgi:CDP-glucose 4,6-dehydratase
LEPLRGYLAVAESLYELGPVHGEAWNFGPEQSDVQTVEWIVRELAAAWGGAARWELDEAEQPHEANYLKLDWSKAEARLGWRPALPLKDALAMTLAWYRAKQQGQQMRDFTISQIKQYAAKFQTEKTSVAKYIGVDA